MSDVCGITVQCAEFISGLGSILSLASAGLSVIQGIAGMRSAQQNAAYAKADAQQALLQGDTEANRQRRINAAQQAELVAQTGAQGTTMTGSPMEVYLENAKQGELQAQDLKYGAQLKARSYNQQADIYNREASASLFTGIAKGAIGLGSTLLNSTKTAPTTQPPVLKKDQVIKSQTFKLPGY